ncbi:MAG: hypothetical protein ACXWU9_10970 [Telluria sp.]
MQDFQNAAYGTGGQLAPQGFFGGLLGAPLGGAIGRGIGGLFGNSGLGNQIGQIAGGIGGSLLPFGADPVSQAYAQQAQQQQMLQQLQQQQQQQQAGQFAPQGWFGNLIGQVGQPLGGAIGGLFGNAGAGQTIGGVAGQLGKLLPFGADPVAAAYAQQLQQAQQQQFSPQGWGGNLLSKIGQPLGSTVGGWFGNAGLGSTIGGAVGQLGKLLPFGADPVAAAYAQQLQAQQQQLAPQGWIGDLIGRVAEPIGSTVGGWLGNEGVGSTIGEVAGQLGQFLPFGADPVAAAYAQQQMQQAAQQQQQLAPQGWFGNIIGQVGQPLGGAIGGLFGNRSAGQAIGGIAGQLGSLLPFGAEPQGAGFQRLQQQIQQLQQQYQQQVAQLVAQQQQQQQIQQMQLGQQQPPGMAPQSFGLPRSMSSLLSCMPPNRGMGQMLPFGTDPVSAAYAQQAQLAAQQGMQQYSPQQTLH